MGSSRPNCWRRLRRTSAGMLGFSANSSKGSPGAMASTVNSTRLMPINVGMVMRKRRSRYLCTSSPHALCLPVPIGQSPKIGIPIAQFHPLELMAHRPHPIAPNYRDEHDILDQQVVHANDERSPLDRIQLALRLFPEMVILGVRPAHDISPRPVVGFLGDLPADETIQMRLGIGRARTKRIHLDIGVEVGDRIGVCRVTGE